MKGLYCFVISLILLSSVARSQGSQDIDVPYYFDINKDNPLTVHNLLTESLNIQYEDRYGQQKEVALTVFNNKHEPVGVFNLSKTYGLNHFKINLGTVFSSWKETDIYTCQLTDEVGRRYQLLLRKKLPATEDPSVSILVNPIHLKCEDVTGNLVDFYASISGGKAPYTVNWYIMNEARADFLYQPREEQIERPGNTMVVRVDKNPNYYVMVLVKDACGKEQKQMVYLVCEGKKKKINTIFVEPLKKLPNVKGN